MIRNLIFDVGGVLIGYRWKEMLVEDLGFEEAVADEVGALVFGTTYWANEFDRGTITFEELLERLGIDFPHRREEITKMLMHPSLMNVDRPKVWEAIQKLKNQGYRIYLLSNYSKILFDIHTRDMTIHDILDGRVISYEINYIKPEPEIYQSLLKKYNLIAEECLFFDDREVNLAAAKEQGFETVLVENENGLLEKLYELQ